MIFMTIKKKSNPKLPRGFDYDRFPNSTKWSKKEEEVLQININALNQTMDTETMDRLVESNCVWGLQVAMYEDYNSTEKEKEEEE